MQVVQFVLPLLGSIQTESLQYNYHVNSYSMYNTILINSLQSITSKSVSKYLNTVVSYDQVSTHIC